MSFYGTIPKDGPFSPLLDLMHTTAQCTLIQAFCDPEQYLAGVDVCIDMSVAFHQWTMYLNTPWFTLYCFLDENTKSFRMHFTVFPPKCKKEEVRTREVHKSRDF